MSAGASPRFAANVVARTLRQLALVDAGGLDHLSAASSLVRIGQRLYVAADDEHHLGVFDLSDQGSGRLVRLFDGELPRRRKDRKAAKPDLEALLQLPASASCPHGALLALGSGSRPQRRRGVLLALDADGALSGAPRPIDLQPLYAELAQQFDKPNIEGAFVAGAAFCLLHRGAADSANACVRFEWSAVARWIEGGGSAPRALAVEHYELGAIDGVPLAFTDAAALPDGGWVFCAAAEDTDNAYDDGGCKGSAIGVVDAMGRLAWMALLQPVCKVEGIALSMTDGRLDLLLVSDADDREAPALLMTVTLPEPRFGS